jgi:hypothetical protein
MDHLPDELVLYIFVFTIPSAQSYSKFEDNSSKTIPNESQIFAFSQTCHRWRVLALSAQHLWTTLALESSPAPLTDMVLSRTGKALLDVFYDPFWNGIPEEAHMGYTIPLPGWDYILRNSHRLRELSLPAMSCNLTCLLEELGPMPALERWNMRCTTFPAAYESSVLPCIPQDAFNHVQPLSSLTHLRFEDCVPHPESPIYSNLTTLIIEISAELAYNDRPAAVQDIIRILSHCPRLTILDLVHVTHPKVFELGASSAISLRHLKQLSLDEIMGNSLALMQHIRVPASASVEIRDSGPALNRPYYEEEDYQPYQTVSMAKDLLRKHLTVYSETHAGMEFMHCAILPAQHQRLPRMVGTGPGQRGRTPQLWLCC